MAQLKLKQCSTSDETLQKLNSFLTIDVERDKR